MNSETGNILGGVLAGGLSRRMGGRDKSLVLLNDKTLISHVIARLETQVSTIVINANGNPERFDNSGYPVICDIIEGFAGPLAGIHALLDHARRSNPEISHVATVAADTPFFPDNFVANSLKSISVIDNSDPTIVLAKSSQNNHPVFGLWPVTLLESLETFLKSGETRKVMAFVQMHPYRFEEFPFYEFDGCKVDPFFNINNPDDLGEAQSIIVGKSMGGYANHASGRDIK